MAKATKLRSVGYYTQALNTGTEYAVREDGAVFVRERYWGGRYFVTSKWARNEYWDNELKGLPERHCFGFGRDGLHIFVDSTRLKLPQD